MVVSDSLRHTHDTRGWAIIPMQKGIWIMHSHLSHCDKYWTLKICWMSEKEGWFRIRIDGIYLYPIGSGRFRLRCWHPWSSSGACHLHGRHLLAVGNLCSGCRIETLESRHLGRCCRLHLELIRWDVRAEGSWILHRHCKRCCLLQYTQKYTIRNLHAPVQTITVSSGMKKSPRAYFKTQCLGFSGVYFLGLVEAIKFCQMFSSTKKKGILFFQHKNFTNSIRADIDQRT